MKNFAQLTIGTVIRYYNPVQAQDTRYTKLEDTSSRFGEYTNFLNLETLEIESFTSHTELDNNFWLMVKEQGTDIEETAPEETKETTLTDIREQLEDAKKTDWNKYAASNLPENWDAKDKLKYQFSLSFGRNEIAHAVVNISKKEIMLFGFYGNSTDGGYYTNVLKVGDKAVYDSYNFDYIGTITNITAKTASIKNSNISIRLKTSTFSYYNWSPNTINKAIKGRNEWSY